MIQTREGFSCRLLPGKTFYVTSVGEGTLKRDAPDVADGALCPVPSATAPRLLRLPLLS